MRVSCETEWNSVVTWAVLAGVLRLPCSRLCSCRKKSPISQSSRPVLKNCHTMTTLLRTGGASSSSLLTHGVQAPPCFAGSAAGSLSGYCGATIPLASSSSLARSSATLEGIDALSSFSSPGSEDTLYSRVLLAPSRTQSPPSCGGSSGVVDRQSASSVASSGRVQ